MNEKIMKIEEVHIGRSWDGNDLEKDCPCPKQECGLVVLDWAETNNCPQHSISAGKTIRQMHRKEDCPGNIL